MCQIYTLRFSYGDSCQLIATCLCYLHNDAWIGACSSSINTFLLQRLFNSRYQPNSDFFKESFTRRDVNR